MERSIRIGVWCLWIVINFLGTILCGVLLLGVYLLGKRRTSVDVFIANLCLGCLSISTPSIVFVSEQVWGHSGPSVNTVNPEICEMQATFLVIGIAVQCLSIMMMAWRNYLAVIRQYLVSERTAKVLTICIWTLAGAGIGVFHSSSITSFDMYCMYDFTSTMKVWWTTPIMLVAFISMAYCYLHIFCASRITNDSVQRYNIRIDGPMSSRNSKFSSPAEHLTFNSHPGVPCEPSSPQLSQLCLESKVCVNPLPPKNPDLHITIAPIQGPPIIPLITPIQTSSIDLIQAPVNRTISEDGRSDSQPISSVPCIKTISPTASPRRIRDALPPQNTPGLQTPRLHALGYKDRGGDSPTANESVIVRMGFRGMHRRVKSQMPLRVARQSVIYLLIFVSGWILLPTYTIYAVCRGTVTGAMIVVLLTFAFTHSLTVPLVYGYSNHRLQVALIKRYPYFRHFFSVSLSSFKSFPGRTLFTVRRRT